MLQLNLLVFRPLYTKTYFIGISASNNPTLAAIKGHQIAGKYF